MDRSVLFSAALEEMRRRVKQQAKPLPAPHPAAVLFFSCSDGESRAQVITVTGSSFDAIWHEGLRRVDALAARYSRPLRWLRVDWPEDVLRTSWDQLETLLHATKRNYSRLGLSLTEDFSCAFLEQEINANAMFYAGHQRESAALNEANFLAYFQSRHPDCPRPAFSHDEPIVLFSGAGMFLDGNRLYPLHPTGPKAGRRVIGDVDPDLLTELISDASFYLADQVKTDGLFVYGYHPCFDRMIATYNTLRHASTTYAMIEAYEVTLDETLRQAIERSVNRMTEDLVRFASLPDGTEAAFLVEFNNEIKLGGNAVALLALTMHARVFKTSRHQDLMRKLAEGIRFMQDPRTGAFRHVLSFPTLETRQEFRVIYYEGEAAFALMRLYELSGDQAWLECVELAFAHFIASNHARHHDHWLGYCANELTRHRPREEYFRFAIDNVADHLDFVADRITTFPTLLELMMATAETVERIKTLPAFHHLLTPLDMTTFEEALDKRVHHVLNGHFWPEYAMYMQNPQRILGSFFIRHHAFRVRIDDVEHYLSGLIAYKRYLERKTVGELGSSNLAGARRLAAGVAQ